MATYFIETARRVSRVNLLARQGLVYCIVITGVTSFPFAIFSWFEVSQVPTALKQKV